MREIKFRGKHILGGAWLYGSLVRNKTINRDIVSNIIPLEGYSSYENTIIKVDTIGQFTGLTDKNGKEIFEGDIVRYDMGGECEVSYCVGGGFAGFDLSPAFHGENQLTDVKVIGNIHDNPELLKDGTPSK